MNKIINSLTVLRGLENDGVFSSLTEYAESVYEGNPSEEKFNDLAAAVYECGAESSVRAYIQKLILTDENAFSVCCTRTGNPSDYLKNAYLKDVATIEGLFACLEDCNQFCSGEDLKTFNVDFGNNFEANIVQFYRRHGYGKFIYNRAFTYEDGALKPITAVSSTTLDQLKDYENEKTIIHMPNFVKNKIRNIEGNFYLDYYDDLLIYLEGMVYTYGVIDMKKAYEYISNVIPINFNKFNSIVLFTTYMELDNIYFKSPEMVLANIELTEDQISKLANKKIKLEKYDLKFFKSMADGTYMKNLKEYKSFRNYLKNNFRYDLNDYENLRGELIQSYSDIAQVDERKALQALKMMIFRRILGISARTITTA